MAAVLKAPVLKASVPVSPTPEGSDVRGMLVNLPLRLMNMGLGDDPEAFLDDCWRWLEPDQLSGAQVAEDITLEQFIQVLPTGGKEWVQRHCPKTLAEAVSLMEDYMAAERPSTGLPSISSGQASTRRYEITVGHAHYASRQALQI
uniref:SCAN box domain-containing protein n=1 Tax=Pelusios castaneus TaxID=367368 RepID=A0A8C8RV86_9SAUR